MIFFRWFFVLVSGKLDFGILVLEFRFLFSLVGRVVFGDRFRFLYEERTMRFFDGRGCFVNGW